MLNIVLFMVRRDRPWSNVVFFRKISDKKIKVGEILFQNEGALNIQERHFLNHNKGQVLMAFASERDIEGDICI